MSQISKTIDQFVKGVQVAAQVHKDINEIVQTIPHADLLTLYDMVSDPGFILGDARGYIIGLVRSEITKRMIVE